MTSFLLAYLPLLLLTMVIEGLWAAVAAPRGRRLQAVRAMTALNLFSHPLLALMASIGESDAVWLEPVVAAFEWWGCRALLGIGLARGLWLALPANALSFAAGVLLAAAAG